MNTNLSKFIKINKTVPAITGEWNFPQMNVLTVRLLNGKDYNLTSDDVDYLNSNEHNILWKMGDI